MMHILSAESESDCAEWMRALEELPSARRDLHFEPGYVRAYARQKMAQGMCAIYSRGDTRVVHPFVCHGENMEVAYGYGGLLTSWDLQSFNEYRYELDGWMRKNCLLHESARLHPLVGSTPPLGAIPKQQKLITFIDLSPDNPLCEMSKGHRAAIAVAEREGVRMAESDDLDLFMHLYAGMLARRDADPKWRFRKSLLEQLAAAYPGGGFRMLLAGPKCAAPQVACILLGAYDTCYYHYAASCELPGDGAGHLLVVTAAMWAKGQGYKRLHLGGGLTDDPQDGLLRFKSGFSKRRAWCYVYNRTVTA